MVGVFGCIDVGSFVEFYFDVARAPFAKEVVERGGRSGGSRTGGWLPETSVANSRQAATNAKSIWTFVLSIYPPNIVKNDESYCSE